jgi:hypothetical protein
MSERNPDNVVASAVSSQSSPKKKRGKKSKIKSNMTNMDEAKAEVDAPKATSSTQQVHEQDAVTANTPLPSSVGTKIEFQDKAEDRSTEDVKADFAALSLSSTNFNTKDKMSPNEAFKFLGVTKDTVSDGVIAAAKAKVSTYLLPTMSRSSLLLCRRMKVRIRPRSEMPYGSSQHIIRRL